MFFLLGVFGTQTFASRATNLVLGAGDAGTVLQGGSFFYEDNYNIFYNPAYVNDFKNWAIIEKSGAPNATAQGGFVASIASFNFGLYLNRGNAIPSQLGLASGGFGVPGTITNQWSPNPVRPIDVFIGGDMGFKWGLGLTYSSAATIAGNSSLVVLHGGAEINGFEPFVSGTVSGSDVNGSHSFFRGGARYKWGEWTPYLAFATFNDPINALGTASNHELNIGGGLGRNAHIAEGVRLLYALSYWSVNDSVNSRNILPIDLSLEGDVVTWMTLRAGLSYRLIDRTSGVSAGDNTTGRFGATAHAGKVDFEFAVGGGSAAGNIDSGSFDLANGLFTAANLTYRW